jgi:antitoxin YefM
MLILTASKARSTFYRLIDQTAESHQPIVINGKRNNAVLISAEDWSYIQEKLHLLQSKSLEHSHSTNK